MFGRFSFTEETYFSFTFGVSIFFGFYSGGSVSYEVHDGPESQDILSVANQIVNTIEDMEFTGTWLLLATWGNMTEEYYFGYNTVSLTLKGATTWAAHASRNLTACVSIFAHAIRTRVV